MIKAKHHFLIYPLFKWLTRFLLKRNFYSINIEGEYQNNDKSVLVIANHISWWDGFWVEYLNQKKIHNKFYFMMQEEHLKKHWYFQYTGGYSIKEKSRSIIDSINYTIKLLTTNNNLVLIFPQGQIHSSHNSTINFKKGIYSIIKQCPDDTQILFTVNITDYFSNSKPHLFIYIKTYNTVTLRHNNIEEIYNQFYINVLNSHKNKIS